jgi:hypothetical protein
MACGSRPVERAPEPGAFPTVGINPAAGLLRTAASVLNPPPPTAGWQIASADRAEPGQSRAEPIRNRPSQIRDPTINPIGIGQCPSSPKLEAVCRAGWRGERRRGAVRMTARGSVTPGMACGSRPVERIPEPGVFPTVGINQRPGVKGAGPYAPLPPPPTAGWQIAMADQGGTGQVGTDQVGTGQSAVWPAGQAP